MPERAEIEAVAGAISGLRAGGGEVTVRRYAAQAIAALDRVRDARGDDAEAIAEFIERYPERWGHGPGRLAADIRATFGRDARSPQGEDHEVPCPRCDGRGREGGNTMPASRVCSLCHGTGKQVVRSLSRDGTVAVEDVRAFVDFCAHGMVTDQTPADEFAQAVRWRARRLLAQFGPARAGESDEGGNQ
jgi:hypothetical protein